jgi:hypothetical protein
VSTHECPAPGCTRQVAARQVLCRDDWYRVPQRLRGALWAAWRGGAGAGSPEHYAAMADAIGALKVTP